MNLSARWNIVPGDALADKLTILEESGYEYVDLSGPALEVSPDALLNVFAGRSVGVGTIDLLHSVLNADEEARKRRMKRNHELLDLAKALGAFGALVHPIFAQPPAGELVGYLGLTPAGTPGNSFKGMPAEVRAIERQTELLIPEIKELASRAEQIGVILPVEPLNRYETYYFNRLEHGVEVCKVVDSPAVKVLLDFFHIAIEESDVSASITAAAGHIGYVHISENNRGQPGHGHFDFKEAFSALKAVGYDGPLGVACEPIGDPCEALKETATSVRRLWAEAQPVR